MNKSQQVVKAYSVDNAVEAKVAQGINEANKLTLSVPLNDRLDSNIFYALIPTDDRTNYLMFKLNDESIENDRITYTGIDAAYDELRGYAYIKEIRPVNRTAKEILQLILKDTRWEVGYIDSSNTISTSFYYQPVLECIQQVVQLFNVEVTFTYSFNTKTHEITARQVNVYKQQGRRTGKRFEYGSNLLTVTREEDSQDIVTALVGRGKGEEKLDEDTGEATGGYSRRIGFKDVVWSKVNGDPTDKPAGQEYVENPEATKIFGYDDGTPRIGIVIFEDIEDPAELLQATWASLISSCRPKVSFKASVTDTGDLRLGDTIAIIRHELGIEYFTRVFKVVRDLKDEHNNTVEMGDDLSKNSLTSYVTNISNTVNQAVQTANDAVVSAGSKNKNYYSTTKPKSASEGDNLFLNLGNGEFEHWVWHNNQWEFVQSTQDVKNVEKNVQDAQKEIEQAKKDIVTNRENANEAITALTETVTGLKGQVADSVNKSDFEVLSNQINAKVSKGDVVSELNLEAGRALISSNKIVLDADSVIFNGKAFIPDAAISGISADKITAGTLDAGKISVINMNADNIVAGSIKGKNVNIDLEKGDIRFSAGRFHNADDTFDINIDEHYLFSEDKNNLAGKTSLSIKDGELTLGKGTYFTNYDDYFKVTRTDLFSSGNGISGSAVGTATVLAGKEQIALVQASDLSDVEVPFFDKKDSNENQIQAGVNTDFVGVGVSQPYSSNYLLQNHPYTIYISSGDNGATLIRGKRIEINTMVNSNKDSYGCYVEIGTDHSDMGLTHNPGNDTYLQAQTFYINFDISKNTTGMSPNLAIDFSGRLVNTTSASRFKTNIQRLTSDDYGEKLLNVLPAIWNDKSELKQYKAFGLKPRKSYGMIAEDVADAGLELLVSRDKNGEITGIQYDRIGVALIPVIKKLKQKVERLENRLNEKSN